jgi:hypothetical protein
MMAPVNIASYLVEGLLGLTARDRFSAMQQHGNTGVMTSGWFAAVCVILLLGSAAALITVSFYKKVKALKMSGKENKTTNRPAVTPDRAKMTGGAAPVNSRTSSTNLEKAPVTREATPVKRAEPAAKTVIGVEIALFPFSKKFDTVSGDDEQFLDFWQGTITRIEGKVIFLETPMTAGAGDRVLMVISSAGDNDEKIQEMIEDVGVVRQIRPAESMSEPEMKRFEVELTGLSDEQAAALNDFLKRVSVKAEVIAAAGAK